MVRGKWGAVFKTTTRCYLVENNNGYLFHLIIYVCFPLKLSTVLSFSIQPCPHGRTEETWNWILPQWGLVLPVNQNLGCYLITPFNHSAVENNLRLKRWRLGKLGWRRFNHFVATMLLHLWHIEHRLYCYGGGQVQTICHKANSLQIQVLTMVFWCQFLRNLVCYSFFFIDMVAIWDKCFKCSFTPFLVFHVNHHMLSRL